MIPARLVLSLTLLGVGSAVGVPSVTVEARRRLSTPAEPCFNFTLEDSVGDGWDGATYTISNFFTGAVVKSGTLETGFNSTDEVCFDRGTCFTIEVTAGDYPNEISWNLGGFLDGTAPGEVDFYVSDDGNEIIPQDSCLTASPTVTPVPTPFSSFDELRILTLTERNITVEGSIDFRGPLYLSSVDRFIEGNQAVFDGAVTTSFFRLDNTTLTLGGITLQNGWTEGGGGCIYLERQSTLVLVQVIIVNCVADGGSGGEFHADSSSILAIDSRFDSNFASFAGGVAFLSTESKFEANGCTFTSCRAGEVRKFPSLQILAQHSIIQRGGVACVRDSSTLSVTNTSFVRNFGVSGRAQYPYFT